MFLPPPVVRPPMGAMPMGTTYQKGKNAENQKPPLLDLPPNLKAMFDFVAPIPFRTPMERNPPPQYSGVSQYLSLFETTPPPTNPYFEPPVERKKKVQENLRLLHEQKNELLANEWDPHNNTKATSNAFHTLFVGRLSYETTEKKLRREFEEYGPIKMIRIVLDNDSDKSRGYAFIEFENEQDMTTAFRRSEGKKIDGKRIIVDVERGRTVRNWKPMRFGGGLGGRLTREERIQRDEAFGASKAAAERTSEKERGDRGGRSRDRKDDRRDHRDSDSYNGGNRNGRERSRERPSIRDRSKERNNYSSSTFRGGDNYRNEGRRRDSRDRDRDRADKERGGDRGRGHSRDRGDRPQRGGRSRDRR